ncbi:dihydroxyacetone kinase subunit DhaL [Halobacillus karajensis]|uniref:phosphoenolpyruvate--glycerone phosphotransferase n=1 Tax=Halobacillus karajensis TaxID=195088 RepID=A0A024P1P2_9BACI|nr:dihydroxyacetone kinase subunit DhaL [Halobacillus karajensis]CDQ19378.1 PTS-dependent dihydroxyacetone kinase, ADP-binding subunit DhaL [Halobacillus karajensis]CDQ21841.1 PTS-dependent dihydroxyacetone kinase, ADP-binding subunit DhaL [Halobacillus karajensis]CDQ27681.1 PTS-dependent dihydroxyacetone kinase, ADP-binding subunit DhaL [Halobacillus karajensis]
MELTSSDLKEFFKVVVKMIEEQKGYLCELDRKLGDGDHGVTMSIGWQAINEVLEADLIGEDDCGKISVIVGKTFLNAVGSSVGPLYATGLMRGAKVAKKKTVMNEDDLAAYWIAFARGIKERGQAEIGDKTMVDTLEPFANELESKFEKSHNFIEAFGYAVKAGEEGMQSTKDIISKKGRSSRLGGRSIGAQDPGATSAYLILSAFQQFAESRSTQVS